jgi:beta-lactamase superfamily II metal-dependent hydrolase
MSELVVRAYNVLFGDAILVSIPERDQHGTEVTRTLLIDVGNLLASSDEVFTPVVNDIRERTGGEVDLYVMTHEHLDHVQGLLAAANAGINLTARYAWLTGSAAPDYYTTHQNAKKQKSSLAQTLSSLAAQPRATADPWLTMMIRNNSALLPAGALGVSTANYVDHLRTIAPPAATTYVDRTTDISGRHPFAEATLRILAPEEDTSVYYGRLRQPRLAAAPADAAAADAPSNAAPVGDTPPPVGVDAGAFYDLVRSRDDVNSDSVLQIDAAANNTSVVVEITWRGWKLLFCGDAEERSWQTMLDNKQLEPVHFIKIAHHGSVNGTVPDILDTVFPEPNPDGKPRQAVVSTHDKDWNSVPDDSTLDLYRARCTLLDTRSVAEGEAIEATFQG